MSQYQDNQLDRIPLFSVLQTIVFYSSAYLFILLPLAPWLPLQPSRPAPTSMVPFFPLSPWALTPDTSLSHFLSF